jgi:hypothetical protein
VGLVKIKIILVMPRRDLGAVLFVLLFPSFVICQSPCKHFNPDSLPGDYFNALKKEYAYKKKYPLQYEKQILIALSYYPELKNIPIRFRTRVKHATANTRVTWAGLFEPAGSRHYVVTISDSTEDLLRPLLFKNLSFNAQVAVIGHELSHVADPATQTFLQIMKHVISSVSARYIDRAEYNTDGRCIAHGLGYQLLEWSSYVRKKMNTVNWDGPDYAHRPKKRERYMNPGTIEKKISENPVYRVIR